MAKLNSVKKHLEKSLQKKCRSLESTSHGRQQPTHRKGKNSAGTERGRLYSSKEEAPLRSKHLPIEMLNKEDVFKNSVVR